MIWKYRWLFVALILNLHLSSCSNKSQEPEDPAVIISDNLYVVEDDGPLTLEMIDGTTLIFSYEGDVPDINIGNKIVGTDQNGYLRDVLSISAEQSRLLIETGDATLVDVIQRGGFQTTIQLDSITLYRGKGMPRAEVHKFVEGVEVLDDGINLTGVVIFSNSSLEVKIINGEIQFSPDLDIGFEIENWSITEFHTKATGSLLAYADFRATAFEPFSNAAETTLVEIEYGPFVYYIGWMPVVATIKISFTAGYDFSSNLHLIAQTGFDADATVMAGARYAEHEWEAIWEHGQNYEERSTNWEAEGTISLLGYIKPEIEVTFYTVAGPYLNVEPYFSFNGETQYPNWWWNLNGGLTGTLGFQVSILDRTLANFDTELLTWEREIGSGSGTNLHTVTPAPNTPDGPDNGTPGQSLSYSTGGSVCNQDHSVEYQFDWGDDTTSPWDCNPCSYSWSGVGTYCVTAKARCSVDNSVISGDSNCLYVIIGDHIVSPVPNMPSGPSSGTPGQSLTYGTGGSVCNQGHDVQYRFDWDDGPYSSWSESTSASHSWSSEDTYYVRAQARCATNTNIESGWSDPQIVVIDEDHTVTPPNTPNGPGNGYTNQNYTYSTGGSVCSRGHGILYHFAWGDDSFSDWGEPSASHSWSSVNTYCVTAQAKCEGSPSVITPPSDCKYVVISEQPDCTVDIYQPNSSSVWQEGTSYNIRWTPQNCGSSDRVDIDLHKGGVWKGDIIENILANDGSGSWTVNDYGGGTDNDYQIKITDTNNNSNYDLSDNFAIIATAPVWFEITWLSNGNFYRNGNYPPSSMTTEYNYVDYNDPSWSSCQTPDTTVHAVLNPWLTFDGWIRFNVEGQEGIYIDPSCHSVTFTVTADFKQSEDWLRLSFGTCNTNWMGTAACDNYIGTRNRLECGSGSYYHLELHVLDQYDEVAVAKLRVDFNGWEASYGINSYQGQSRKVTSEE